MKTVLIINDKKDFFDLLNEWETTKPVKSDNIALKEQNQEDYLSQREAARFLRISLPTIISWKKEKKVPYYQQGRTILFKKSELLDAMRQNESLIK
jgi:excisionase family DNA binding protein